MVNTLYHDLPVSERCQCEHSMDEHDLDGTCLVKDCDCENYEPQDDEE